MIFTPPKILSRVCPYHYSGCREQHGYMCRLPEGTPCSPVDSQGTPFEIEYMGDEEVVYQIRRYGD